MAENKNKSALAALSALTHGVGEDEADPAVEAQRSADMTRVLDTAAEITDNDIFEMQALIEDCALELRVQIRDMYDGEEDDEEVS